MGKIANDIRVEDWAKIRGTQNKFQELNLLVVNRVATIQRIPNRRIGIFTVF